MQPISSSTGSPFKLVLLGGFHLTINGVACPHFYSDKVRALFCYLVLAAEEPVRREVLTDLLWAGYTPLSARASLRRALSELRKTLLPYPLLVATYHAVHLVNTPSVLWCDVLALQTLASGCVAHRPAPLPTCPACVTAGQQAVALYHGEFLQGFTHLDSAPFQSWRQAQAARLAHTAHLTQRLAGYGYAASADLEFQI